MQGLEKVKKLAMEALVIRTPGGDVDHWLWDRAQRVVRNTEYISHLPELTGADIQIDRFCLYAAAYFIEAIGVTKLQYRSDHSLFYQTCRIAGTSYKTA